MERAWKSSSETRFIMGTAKGCFSETLLSSHKRHKKTHFQQPEWQDIMPHHDYEDFTVVREWQD